MLEKVVTQDKIEIVGEYKAVDSIDTINRYGLDVT